MSNVIVVGGGAAGMMAAYSAAVCGHNVVLLEKNEKLGKKLYITGKGRCNVTNASPMPEVMKNVVSNPRFLYSAFSACSNSDVIELIESTGCPLKVERGQRVFPQSDKSSDIIKAFSILLRRAGVDIRLNTAVKKLLVIDDRAVGVITDDGKELRADALILCTGGLSYTSTGSDGAGHRMAQEAGHSITSCIPALVPFEAIEQWPRQLQGLALKNVAITIMDNTKKLYSGFGEMLFTHFGISGPLILSASSYAARILKQRQLKLFIDLKPALSEQQLDARLLRDFESEKNKLFRNSLDGLFPGRLAEEIVKLSEIDPQKEVNRITKEERRVLVQLTKKLPLTIIGTRGFNEAIITQGGINVHEINPATMESKLVSGLYFAGEIIDVDALTGGYNLQLAWSTACLAGRSV